MSKYSGAILKLLSGFWSFREKYFGNESKKNTALYSQLVTGGQTPKTLLIGCCDSRVDPAILTESAPGELFILRNVANLVPPCEPSGFGFHGTSSALEFAVSTLKVENIVILGHRQCGGIQVLMRETHTNQKNFLDLWMSIVKEARDKVRLENPDADIDTLCRKAETESIKVSIRNLKSFPFIVSAIKERNLRIYGFYFDLEQGQLWEYEENTQDFHQIHQNMV